MKSTLLILQFTLLLVGCAITTPPPICTLKPYWDEENISRIKDKEDCCRYQCVPAPSYQKWNECVGDCSKTVIQSKTKPYEPKEWIRPRPYAYPWYSADFSGHSDTIMDSCMVDRQGDLCHTHVGGMHLHHCTTISKSVQETRGWCRKKERRPSWRNPFRWPLRRLHFRAWKSGVKTTQTKYQSKTS